MNVIVLRISRWLLPSLAAAAVGGLGAVNYQEKVAQPAAMVERVHKGVEERHQPAKTGVSALMSSRAKAALAEPGIARELPSSRDIAPSWMDALTAPPPCVLGRERPDARPVAREDGRERPDAVARRHKSK